jgi:K+-sensing histidine kinase KdpD
MTVGTAPGLAGGAATLALVSIPLVLLRDEVDTATAALVLVLPGLAAALVGGTTAAMVTAGMAAVVFNIGFLEPYGTLKVGRWEDVLDLSVLMVVAVVTGTLVAREAERRALAQRRAEEVAAARTEQERLSAEAVALTLAGDHRAALLRSVSHDLRTPLSTIRAVASDLRDGGGAYDDATRDELLDLVVDEAERLDRLVANLLSLSRVEAGALEADLQPIPLDELLEQCVRRHARLVRDRKVSIDVPLTLPLVKGDWMLLDQALTNVVANAVRHAPKGSRIWVSAARAEPGRVAVRVTDQGPGIARELRAQAFEPFRRGPGSTSSGIGLAIVRAVVEAHHGEVAIEDGPDGGTTIVLTLPAHDG